MSPRQGTSAKARSLSHLKLWPVLISPPVFATQSFINNLLTRIDGSTLTSWRSWTWKQVTNSKEEAPAANSQHLNFPQSPGQSVGFDPVCVVLIALWNNHKGKIFPFYPPPPQKKKSYEKLDNSGPQCFSFLFCLSTHILSVGFLFSVEHFAEIWTWKSCSSSQCCR